VPCVYRCWRGTAWKQFEIDCIRIVWQDLVRQQTCCIEATIPDLTDGNHAFVVVVEILKDHLAECIDLPSNDGLRLSVYVVPIKVRRFVFRKLQIHYNRICVIIAGDGSPQFGVFFIGEKSTLLFHIPEQARQFPHDIQIATEVDIFIKNQSKIENELVSVISAVFDAYWVADDSVFGYANSDRSVTELLAGYDEPRHCVEIKQWRLFRVWIITRRYDGSFWYLVKNTRTFSVLVFGSLINAPLSIPFSGWNRAKKMALIIDWNFSS
jgi:hypothetical protein